MLVAIVAAAAFLIVYDRPRVAALPHFDLSPAKAALHDLVGVIFFLGLDLNNVLGVLHVWFLSPRVADRSACFLPSIIFGYLIISYSDIPVQGDFWGTAGGVYVV